MALKLPTKTVVSVSHAAKSDSSPTALDADTDSLNEKIREFERALVERRFAVSARVQIDYHEPTGVRTELEFGKWADGWRLLVVDSVERTDAASNLSENKDILFNASRDVRLEATQHFLELTRALVRAVEFERQRVAKAVNATNEAIAFVKGLPR